MASQREKEEREERQLKRHRLTDYGRGLVDAIGDAVLAADYEGAHIERRFFGYTVEVWGGGKAGHFRDMRVRVVCVGSGEAVSDLGWIPGCGPMLCGFAASKFMKFKKPFFERCKYEDSLFVELEKI